MHTRSSSAFNVLVQNVHATMLQINIKMTSFRKASFGKKRPEMFSNLPEKLWGVYVHRLNTVHNMTSLITSNRFTSQYYFSHYREK